MIFADYLFQSHKSNILTLFWVFVGDMWFCVKPDVMQINN